MSNLDPKPTAQTTAIIQVVPVATIIAYAGDPTTPPAGWLYCNGATFDQAKYPDLYVALGNRNALPDLRGYFLRGLDPTGNVDPEGSNRSLLSEQTDKFKEHTHTMALPPYYKSEHKKGNAVYGGTTTFAEFHQQLTDPTGDKETRPINKAVHYIIFAGIPQPTT